MASLDVLEIVSYQGFEKAVEMSRISRTSRTMSNFFHPRLRRYARVIQRTLRKVVPLETLMDLLINDKLGRNGRRHLFQHHYPSVHVKGMIRLVTWKSRDPATREHAKRLVLEGKTSKQNLGDLVTGMNNRDLMYVGW
jgi:hypothetical protein